MLRLRGPPEEAAHQLISYSGEIGVLDAPEMCVNSTRLMHERFRTRAASGRDAAIEKERALFPTYCLNWTMIAGIVP